MGSNFVTSFLALFQIELIHKGKNLLLEGEILSFKSKPTLEGYHCPGKQTRSQKLLPFVKIAKRHRSVPIDLKIVHLCLFYQGLFSKKKTICKKCKPI